MKTIIAIDKDLRLSGEELAAAWNADEEYSDLPFFRVEKAPQTFDGELLEFLKNTGPYITVLGPIVVKVLQAIFTKAFTKKRGSTDQETSIEVKKNGDDVYIKITSRK